MADNEPESSRKQLDLIAKLLYMQVRFHTEKLEEQLVSTDKQKKLYSALDGSKNMEQLAKSLKVSKRMVEDTLPLWERKGLVIGFGKGKGKRYFNLDNLRF